MRTTVPLKRYAIAVLAIALLSAPVADGRHADLVDSGVTHHASAATSLPEGREGSARAQADRDAGVAPAEYMIGICPRKSRGFQLEYQPTEYMIGASPAGEKA